MSAPHCNANPKPRATESKNCSAVKATTQPNWSREENPKNYKVRARSTAAEVFRNKVETEEELPLIPQFPPPQGLKGRVQACRWDPRTKLALFRQSLGWQLGQSESKTEPVTSGF